jgi:hypothetical protein
MDEVKGAYHYNNVIVKTIDRVCFVVANSANHPNQSEDKFLCGFSAFFRGEPPK